jgi:hypothetical protein
MGYTILVFLFIVLGTYFLYKAFGQSAGAADVQRVKDRLLGKTKAEKAAGPSVDIPPLPFSPVKFSGLIERDLACDRRERLPR